MEQLKWNEILTDFFSNKDALQCFKSISGYNSDLYNHSVSVAFLSTILGGTYKLNDKDLTDLFIAALLHDYGKLYISKDIIEKPDKLTDDERKVIELHSLIGYAHLKAKAKFSDNILNGVLDHHERLDGGGYSQRKKDEGISVYAKIISIADVYDAMTSDRIYHKRIPKEIVYDYMKKNSGTQFDRNLTGMFLDLIFDIDLDLIKNKFRTMLKGKILEKYATISY